MGSGAADIKRLEKRVAGPKYITIADTSRATATRGPQELVTLGALAQTGALKATRYHLLMGEDGPLA